MGVCGQKIILVALNRSCCAGDTSTMLSTVEVLVMGSDPLSFRVEGKVIPAQGKAILFLSISSLQELNVKPFLFKNEWRLNPPSVKKCFLHQL